MPQSNSEQSIPVTWSELVPDSQPSATHTLTAVKDLHESMASTAAGRLISDEFLGLANALARVAIILGPSEALSAVSLFNRFLGSAIEELSPEVKKGHVVSAISMLNYAVVAACCASDLPEQATTLEAVWLPQIAKYKHDLTESESKYMAFAALASGALDLVPTFIGGGALPQRFRPGETFQFNTQGFVRYIAVAMLSGTKVEDIEPAWRDFLDCFPRKLASETLDWVDLMWAARTMMEHFEHQPVTVVAENLHRLVISLAEGEL
jgi:hypothetical protein